MMSTLEKLFKKCGLQNGTLACGRCPRAGAAVQLVAGCPVGSIDMARAVWAAFNSCGGWTALKSRREASVKIKRSVGGLSCVGCTMPVARKAGTVPRGGRISKSRPASPTLRWQMRRGSDDDDESRLANPRHGVLGRAELAKIHLESPMD
jgi:hypothetical protein